MHYLIPIQPPWVDLILAGEKDVEMRKGAWNLDKGATIWIWETRPVSAVVGACKVVACERFVSPMRMWVTYKERTGMTEVEMESWVGRLGGSPNHSPQWSAIELEMPVRLSSPLRLADIRAHARELGHPEWQPPQSKMRLGGWLETFILDHITDPPEQEEEKGETDE